MQGVDEYEAGPERTGAPGREIGKVAEIAMAPGRTGPDGVELDGESPRPAGRDPRQFVSGWFALGGSGIGGLADQQFLRFLTAMCRPRARRCRTVLLGKLGDLVERREDGDEGLLAHLGGLVARVLVHRRDPSRFRAAYQVRISHPP